jgi:lactoylglutathione lyase
MNFSSEMYAGVCEQAPAVTRGFVLNHSMLRVKDPAVSLDFYSRIMGMRVLRKLDFPEMKFSLYFLAVAEVASNAPDHVGDRTAWTFSQSGILELTHNWGT